MPGKVNVVPGSCLLQWEEPPHAPIPLAIAVHEKDARELALGYNAITELGQECKEPAAAIRVMVQTLAGIHWDAKQNAGSWSDIVRKTTYALKLAGYTYSSERGWTL